MIQSNELPVVIVEAGHVGLATAAQLTLRDIPFLLFEADESEAASI